MSNNIAWKNIEWDKVQNRINRCQRRIYKASKENNRSKVMFLQNIIINSLDAKLLAVRRVTTENQGKKTSGIDNKIYNTDEKKIKLVQQLKVDGTAKPIKRVYIPTPLLPMQKQGRKSEKRPLGIPIIKDRAKQYLVLLALEPEWEAKFEPNSYGFRPGRSCHDAVVSIFGHLRLGRNKPDFKKYVLDADLKDCFDNINHQYLLNKLATIPAIEKQVKSWLEAGIIESNFKPESEHKIQRNKIGTPQGGILSPFLANIAFHGMENYLKDWIATKPSPDGKPMSKRDKMQSLAVIRYADDFVVIHKNKHYLIEIKQQLATWLEKTSGLQLNENKTTIVCSTNGFSFLGFHFINIKRYNRMRIKIYPNKSAVTNITNKIGTILRNNRSISTYELIKILKPIITGWCNYYSICECSETFKKLDHLTYNMLRSWVFRRDRKNNRHSIKEKYFPSGNQYNYKGKLYNNNWILVGTSKFTQGIIHANFLPLFSWTESQTHIKIRSEASIYDGDETYWQWRTLEYGGFSYSQKLLLKRQKGRCPWCNSRININDGVDLDHIIPKSKQGCNFYHNLQLLHKQCHKEKTAQHMTAAKPTTKLTLNNVV